MTIAPPITAKELFEQMVEAPPDDTCRTCRFWVDKNWVYDDGFACCSNADVLHTFLARFPLIPPASFGCRFHRAKP